MFQHIQIITKQEYATLASDIFVFHRRRYKLTIVINTAQLHAIPEAYQKVFDAVSEVTKGDIAYDKPNCYKCRFRGKVPGSAHSYCHAIAVINGGSMEAKAYEQAIAAGMMIGDTTVIPLLNFTESAYPIPMVGFRETGIRKGWALWPVNYDPAWLLWCLTWPTGQPQKEGENE